MLLPKLIQLIQKFVIQKVHLLLVHLQRLSFLTYFLLTHWFLYDPVVVWGIICIHGLQERPGHFMCLQRERLEKGKGKTPVPG